MSTLRFDGTAHTLTLFDQQGNQVGQWYANNVLDRSATLRFAPNRTYQIIDRQSPHTHGGNADTMDGPYGSFGIIRMEDFQADGAIHEGVGIHSGRANSGGADHPTMGCIRTSDEAMQAISQHIRNDPLTSITVLGNHDQHNRLPRHQGDHHHRHRSTPPAHSSPRPRPRPPPSNFPMV